jgi:Fe-only nitrogenase accessory protein AnfO
MKIATWVNERGEVVDPYEKNTVDLYERTGDSWMKKKEIGLEIAPGMGIPEVRKRLKGIGGDLEDCQVFLVRETKGLLHVLLEEQGFRTWKSIGPFLEQLENVAQKDTEAVRTRELFNGEIQECGTTSDCSDGCHAQVDVEAQRLRHTPKDPGQSMPQPLPVGDVAFGQYQFNLAEVLQKNPTLNSREVLIPFLEKRAFQKLEIICDHLPRWFEMKADQLMLQTEFEEPAAAGHGMKVVVSVKKIALPVQR